MAGERERKEERRKKERKREKERKRGERRGRETRGGGRKHKKDVACQVESVYHHAGPQHL